MSYRSEAERRAFHAHDETCPLVDRIAEEFVAAIKKDVTEPFREALVEAHQAVIDTEEERDAVQAQLERVVDERDTLQEEVTELRAQLDEQDARIAELKQECDELRERVDAHLALAEGV